MLRPGLDFRPEDRRLCAGLTALVVEDDPAVLHLTVRALEELGMRCFSCWDGETALSWLASNPAPDVVVVDILLPGMSGMALARDIRRSDHLATTRLVVTSAHPDIGNAIAAARIGALLFPKPFRLQELKDAVLRLMRGGKPLPKVLIVDDDDCVREALSSVVAEEGFDPVCACDGDEALRLLKAHAPELVLLDLIMPGIDGISVARALKTSSLTAPIVFVSAREDVAAACARAGAFGHLKKPVDVDDIIAMIRAATSARV